MAEIAKSADRNVSGILAKDRLQVGGGSLKLSQ